MPRSNLFEVPDRHAKRLRKPEDSALIRALTKRNEERAARAQAAEDRASKQGQQSSHEAGPQASESSVSLTPALRASTKTKNREKVVVEAGIEPTPAGSRADAPTTAPERTRSDTVLQVHPRPRQGQQSSRDVGPQAAETSVSLTLASDSTQAPTTAPSSPEARKTTKTREKVVSEAGIEPTPSGCHVDAQTTAPERTRSDTVLRARRTPRQGQQSSRDVGHQAADTSLALASASDSTSSPTSRKPRKRRQKRTKATAGLEPVPVAHSPQAKTTTPVSNFNTPSSNEDPYSSNASVATSSSSSSACVASSSATAVMSTELATAAMDETASAQIMMDLDGTGPGAIRLACIDSPTAVALPHQSHDDGLLDYFDDIISSDDSERPPKRLRRAYTAREESEDSDDAEEVVPEYEVNRILDRRGNGDTAKFLVEWKDLTYEWKTRAELPNCNVMTAVYDRYMAEYPSKDIPFEQFVAADLRSMALMADNGKDDCALHAVQKALEFLGVPTEYVNVVREFADDFLRMMTPTDSKRFGGLKLSQLVKFLREDLPLCGHPVDVEEFENVNYYSGIGTKAAAIAKLGWQEPVIPDGVYLIHAVKPCRRGHCVAMQKKEGKMWVREGKTTYGIMEADWIGNIIFVRQLRLLGE